MSNLLRLSNEHLMLIDQALSDMPYRNAAPVIAEINRQLLLSRQETGQGQQPPDESGEIAPNLTKRRQQLSSEIEQAARDDVAAVLENRPPSNVQRILLLNQELNVIDAAIDLERRSDIA